MSNVLSIFYCGYLAHLGHDRIIRYCNRPFVSAEEMEEVMVERFNSCLRPGDILYHLGDVAWSSYNLSRFFSRLNTRQCHLILGNHDKKNLSEYRKWFQWVGEYKKVTVQGVQLALFHYPIRSWNGKGHGSLHLYGHCHGTLSDSGEQSMDVGVDTNNFYPYALEEIVARLQNRPYFNTLNSEESHNRERKGVNI